MYKCLYFQQIVNAVCVLHNIVIKWRFPKPELHYDEIDEELPRINVNAAIKNENEVRQRITNTFKMIGYYR